MTRQLKTKRHPLKKWRLVQACGGSAYKPEGNLPAVEDVKRKTLNPFRPNDPFEMASDRHGSYALVFKCTVPFQVVTGKLGPIFISGGYWIYVGSAFGQGGLRARLTHHLKPSHRPHWHIDYIKSAMRLVEIWTTTDTAKREHDWAMVFSTLNGASRPIPGFGATDCMCRSHLIHLPRRPGFSNFKKQLRTAIPEHGPLVRFDLNKGPLDGVK